MMIYQSKHEIKSYMTAPNQNTTPPQTAVATKREIRVVEDNSQMSYLFDTAKFEHCYRIAEAMAKASLIPRHLKGSNPQETAANCFLVVNQAIRWHMDPFAVAPETYEVSGKLGYQGKLVAAVINTRAGLAEKLSYVFSGEKGTDDFMVTVSGRFEGEDDPKEVTLTVKQGKTSNQMWTKDPEQKLVYSGSIRWARRHAPESIMGVTTDDDLEMMRDEAKIIAMKPVKTPVFDGPPPPPALTNGPSTAPEPEKPRTQRKRPTMVEEPLEIIPEPPLTTQPTVPPQPTEAVPVETPEPIGAKELRELNEQIVNLRNAADVTEEQLVMFMRAEKWMKDKHKLRSDMSSTHLRAFVAAWQSNTAAFVARIKSANKVAT